MIKQKIFIWTFLVLFNAMELESQTLGNTEPKKILWGLIKIPNDDNSQKEPIYDRIFRSREFATPINYMPIEIRYGIGVNGKLSGSTSSPSATDLYNCIWFDNEVEPLDQNIENLFGTSLDIDIGMINIPNLIMKTSWMNVLTGLNYRSSSIISPKEVPPNWKTGTVLETNKIKFKPEVREYLITNSLQWQPFNSWYLNFRYGYGLAFSKFYYDDDLESINDFPKGTGTSMNVGLGFRYIIDPGKANRFSIGVDLRHSYTKINNIDDPNDLTPVNRFDLANYGIYLSLSTFYGGKKTIGDEAKDIYYESDYLTAKSKFTDFINDYPTHSNKYRALEFIEDCNRRIPYQIMEEGLYFDDVGDSEKALEKYIKARSRVMTNDTLILESLNFRINEIARKWLNSAELLLDRGFHKDALDLVKKVSSFYSVEDKLINKFKSYVVLEEGKKLQSILILGKAMEKYSEALKLNIDLESNVQALSEQTIAHVKTIIVPDTLYIRESDQQILNGWVYDARGNLTQLTWSDMNLELSDFREPEEMISDGTGAVYSGDSVQYTLQNLLNKNLSVEARKTGTLAHFVRELVKSVMRSNVSQPIGVALSTASPGQPFDICLTG